MNTFRLNKIISSYPISELYTQPSPIQRLFRLEKELGTSVNIFIKRDDLLQPLFGNKIRYIEYLYGQYFASSANCLIHAGGLRSNYMAQLAMAGAAKGIPTYLIINGKKPVVPEGNILLEELFATHVEYIESSGETNSESKHWLAEHLESQGKTPFIVDFPLSNYSAYLGYMKCFHELIAQENNGDLPSIDHIFLCSGWHSYLGLRVAADLIDYHVDITAFRPSYWEKSGLLSVSTQIQDFLRIKVEEFESFLNCSIPTEHFDLDESYVGENYAIPNQDTLAAIHMLARLEGILLDPIYSGKAFLGMLNYIQQGRLQGKGTILFLHTGGIINNFSYREDFSRYLEFAQS